MTLNDLKNEIAVLGFDKGLSLDSSLTLAVQRALRFAYAERGTHKNGVLYQRNPLPDFYCDKVNYTPGVQCAFEMNGGTYSLTVSGTGEFTVTDQSRVRTFPFSTQRTRFSGFISGKGKIEFSGKFSYTVYGICHFPEVFSNSTDGVAYTRLKEYKLTEYFPDYAALVDIVRDKDGKAINDASVCSDRLLLPYEYVGEVNVRYRVAAPDVSGLGPDDEIKIDRELIHLIPLLAASYVWLEDDADKAQYYMSLYRDGMAALKVYDTRCLDTAYTDTTGWA